MTAFTAFEERAMHRALALAARGLESADPNPRVGCVIAQDGEIVGEGWHRRAGEAHAEVEALRAAGERAAGATVFVTLEPCCHQGRTPPCTDALIAARVSRVVFALRDPNPRVDGGGAARLAAAGIGIASGLLEAQAAALNAGFVKRMRDGRPWVRLKTAASLDGRTALASGESRWITGEAARADVHDWRARSSAVATGIGTVLADDPRLDRRLGQVRAPILRVLLDRRLRTPLQARLLKVPGPVVIYSESHDAARVEELGRHGAEVVRLREVTPAAVLADLEGRAISSLLVEGGREVATAFFAAGLYDRLEVAVAGRLLGGQTAPGPLGGQGVERLVDAPSVARLKARKCGSDLVLSGFNSRCLQELSANLEI